MSISTENAHYETALNALAKMSIRPLQKADSYKTVDVRTRKKITIDYIGFVVKIVVGMTISA